MDEWNKQFYAYWVGDMDLDTFLAQRSASNLAALERLLEVEAATVDQALIDANVTK